MATDDANGWDTGEAPRGREPILRAPWPPVVLVLALVAAFLTQESVGSDAAIAAFGFSPAGLQEGRWLGLASALFIHGGWPHLILNGLGALAFGAAVARLFGPGAAGGAAFFVFFLICGAGSSLGFAFAHWGAPYVLIGASGGVSGFMGAASRLLERRGALAPLTSRAVVSMGLAWVFVNLAVGLIGLGGVSGDAPIAWEAHLAGYALGLVLVGPFARALRRL